MTSASTRFSVVDAPDRERFEIREGDKLAGFTYSPFVRGYIARHPDAYLELVPRDWRKHFELASDD